MAQIALKLTKTCPNYDGSVALCVSSYMIHVIYNLFTVSFAFRFFFLTNVLTVPPPRSMKIIYFLCLHLCSSYAHIENAHKQVQDGNELR